MTQTTRARRGIDAERVMTVDQVAAYLQLNRLTVYRYIREGRLPAAKIGKLYRVKRADVDQFLEAQKVASQQPSRPSRPPAAAKLPSRSRQFEDAYVGPSHREQMREREERDRASLARYPLDWVMRGFH